MDRLGHPVEGYIAEQCVFAEAAFHVPIAVRPVTKFLYNPGRQRGRGIVQAVGRGQWCGSLQVCVGSTFIVPAVGVLQKSLLDMVKFRAWLQVWAVGSGNVVEMNSHYAAGMAQSQNRAHGGAKIASLRGKAVITQLLHERSPKLCDTKRMHGELSGTV